MIQFTTEHADKLNTLITPFITNDVEVIITTMTEPVRTFDVSDMQQVKLTAGTRRLPNNLKTINNILQEMAKEIQIDLYWLKQHPEYTMYIFALYEYPEDHHIIRYAKTTVIRKTL